MLAAQENSERGKSLLERFGHLENYYQRQINKMCSDPCGKPGFSWMAIYLNEVRERKKSSLWRTVEEVTLVQVVLRQERAHAEENIVTRPPPRQDDNESMNSQDHEDEPNPRVSRLDSTSPLTRSVPGGMPEPDPYIPHSGKHNQEHEIVKITQRYYMGRNTSLKGPLLAELVEEIIVGSSGSKYTQRVTTEIFKDAIDARVVSDFGYDFVEEEKKILIPILLDDSELNKLHEWSKLIRRMDRGVTDEQDPQYLGSRVVRNPRVTWDLPDPGSADTDDLSCRGRGTNKNLVRYHEGPRRTISQPGEDGFVLSRRGESVGHSPYYESTGKELVRYSNPGGVDTRDFARNSGVEGLSTYHEDTRLARNSSRVGNSSLRAESRRGTVFLNERTESPYGYGGSDRDTLPPSRRSVRRGSSTSFSTMHRPINTHSSSHSRTIRRGANVGPLDNYMYRSQSRERRRPSSYSQADAHSRNPDRSLSETTLYNGARSQDAYAREARTTLRDMRFDSIRRSLSQTMPSGKAASHMIARYSETELAAEPATDLEDSSEDDLVLEQRERPITLPPLQRHYMSETETEDLDQENAQLANKSIRDQHSVFDEGLVKVITIRSDHTTQESDSEIIEKQLARYRDNQSPVRMVDGTAETEDGDQLQNSGSQMSSLQVGAALIQDELGGVLPELESLTRI
jgi:hypothetical protein